jgi:hypothetical protein
VVALGVGVAVGVGAGSSSTTKVVTDTLSGRTVTQISIHTRTVERVMTVTNHSGGTPRPAGPDAGSPASGQRRPVSPVQPGGPSETQRFAGNGNRLLGTITVSQPNETLYWSNSAGRFRLLFNAGAVAVDSTAHSGQTAAPPLVYSQVTVITPGRWSLRIG